MNLTTADIYSRLQHINDTVKQNLKRRGMAVPKKNQDGSISVGRFRIVKQQELYYIIDHSGELLYGNINLPQTAAVLANDLATKHFVDRKILDTDQKYGHAAFEEAYQNRLLNNKNVKGEHKDIIRSKIDMVKIKKQIYREQIEQGFLKLIRIR